MPDLASIPPLDGKGGRRSRPGGVTPAGHPHPSSGSLCSPDATLPARGRNEPRPEVLDEIAEALAPYNLILRGGFYPEPGEAGLEGVGTVLLAGNAGGAMWEAFAPHIDGEPDPLNRWTRAVIEPIAAACDARALYPFGEPFWPFQRWARRAEPLHPSPLGLLIHPVYGLWHAYRAALLFRERLELPEPVPAPSPCETCAERPCLQACPVGAFGEASYHVPACAAHLSSGRATCGEVGCHARSACPVGAAWRYPESQIRFHMAAFTKSVTG